MKLENADLADKGNEVVKAIENLGEETETLGELNDEPHLQREEVEGFVAVIVRVIASVFKL